jgi:hypothetical protein
MKLRNIPIISTGLLTDVLQACNLTEHQNVDILLYLSKL